MMKHQYYCKDCGTEREGLLDHPAVGIGGYSWNCPRCNGTVDSREVEPSGDYAVDNEDLRGLWQFLSDLLDGEKLPDPLNEALYGLCDGSLIVVRRDEFEEKNT